MSAVPQGAFAALKLRQAIERSNFPENETDKNLKHCFSLTQAGSEQPPKYSSKLMNSIWGLYNQYSVHNLKKKQEF